MSVEPGPPITTQEGWDQAVLRGEIGVLPPGGRGLVTDDEFKTFLRIWYKMSGVDDVRFGI